MFFKQDKEKNINPGLNSNKSKPSNLSLDLHTMPKTETGHFQKWLVLAGLIFILMILMVLFFI